MKRGYDRARRVSDLIQKSLASMIMTEMDDERFRLVTITGVTVAHDLSFAKIYVSVLTDEEDKIGQIIDALNHAEKSLRYRLAHDIKLRIVPELKFIYDSSIARGFRISSLINATAKDDETNSQ